jgi:uncharacterized protein (UPF0332 family)
LGAESGWAGFQDFAAARAYHTAYYAASALLLAEGKPFRSHRGVVALIHRAYVRSGHLPVDLGRILSTLSDSRSVGAYGGAAHSSHAQANIALIEAQRFLGAVRSLLPPDLFDVVADCEVNPDAGDQDR